MPYTEKQRRFACAQTGKGRKNFKGKPPLTKKEAEEMCKAPLKKEEISEEIEKYFNKNKDEDYLRFDGDELSSVENIMNPDKPAPWDHLSNHEDDEDVDVEISERKVK